MFNSAITPKRLLFAFVIGIFFFASWDLPSIPQENEIETTVNNFGKRTETYKGQATYYHNKYHGRKTASGERYNKRKYTAAIRMNKIDVPFGTILEVTNKSNNKSVQVRVNDKMSNRASAVIDLSRKAAKEIGLIEAGRTEVTIEVITE